jgi:acyl-CoA synthetase (AMP-forming)/AMP-acid ligase II
MSAHDVLVGTGMAYYGWRYWQPLDRAAAQPRQTQLQVLRRILAANASAEFGERHGFRAIRSADDYADRVPVQDYEHLRPYVERQRLTGEPALTQESPVLYAQTSGSTGTPKYVPITPSVLAIHRAEQKIFSYLQHRACPAAFGGRTLGIMGAAVEGILDSGHTVGSVSGHLYRSMPRMVKARFVVPPGSRR